MGLSIFYFITLFESPFAYVLDEMWETALHRDIDGFKKLVLPDDFAEKVISNCTK